MQAKNQKIVVLGTGGTIAGESSSENEGLSYKAAQRSIDDLLQAVAGVSAGLPDVPHASPTWLARVRLRPGKGEVTINGRDLEAYFPSVKERALVAFRSGQLGEAPWERRGEARSVAARST